MRLPKWWMPRVPRSRASDLVDVAGLGCLDGAAWWWQPAVGLAVLGAMLLLVGWVLADEPGGPAGGGG